MKPEVLKIDVDAVLRERLPGLRRFLPRFAVRWLEKAICQDELNDVLDHSNGATGSAFCASVIDYLDVKVQATGKEHFPKDGDKAPIIISNHPLGGLDGIILIDLVARVYGSEPLFVVNDLLMAIKPLADVFVPVNKHGAQSRQNVEEISRAFESDRPLIIFPAGLVSRMGKNGEIADLEWQKMAIAKALKSGRPIVPVYFGGRNSTFFYKFAKLRKKLGVKFNIEMLRLPKEVFRSRGKEFKVIIGNPIEPQEAMEHGNLRQATDWLRHKVYSLSE